MINADNKELTEPWNLFPDQNISYHSTLINSINAGLWQYNATTKELWWSAGFYKKLGFKPGEISATHHYLLEELVHPDDEKTLISISELIKINQSFTKNLRLKTKDNGYCWFECSGSIWVKGNQNIITGAIIDINERIEREKQLEKNEFLLNETGKLAKVGGWEVALPEMSLTWSKEVSEIFEFAVHDEIPSLEDAINYFEPEYRPLIIEALDRAINHCEAYEMELLFRTAKDNVIWVKTKGIPIIDTFGKCTAVRGIFQNIDDIKRKEIELQSSLDLLSERNKSLQNFAFIVSHNLRSHTGNLQFMIDVHGKSKSETDRQEIFNNIQAISDSLSSTIEHLNEIVKIQTGVNRDRKEIHFQTVYHNVVSVIENNINAVNATIETDFSNCPSVNYVPAYLESIFLNLLTNSLKYKHPHRSPVIKCYSYQQAGHVYLVFEDNGSGIDLQKYGSKLFGMYRTFHKNSDAKGIGLFITKNQVESLGGSIDVESEINVGTKFSIKLV